MTKYFYYDADDKKHGPVSKEQLEDLAAQGIIVPNTQVQKEDGQYRYKASIHLPDLRFAKDDSTTDKETPIFDIGFTRFISNTWISILWVIVIVVHFLAALGAMIGATIGAADAKSPVILLALLAIPFSFLFSRMALELAVIFFRIESNTRESKEYLREIKEQLGKK